MSDTSIDPGQAALGAWATFCVGGEMFALRVQDVQEVLMHQPLTPVPLAPEHILGLLNLRGQVMPAIDLRQRLGMPARAPDQHGPLLVLRTADQAPACIVVDDIGDVLELPLAEWRPPPDTLAEAHRHLVQAICPVEKHLLLGLRVEALYGEDERPMKKINPREANP